MTHFPSTQIDLLIKAIEAIKLHFFTQVTLKKHTFISKNEPTVMKLKN